MNVRLMGLDQQISKPVELDEGIVETIFEECCTAEDAEEWVDRQYFGGCIGIADGPQDAVWKFHDEHGSDLDTRGKVYLGHQESKATELHSDFVGEFGRPDFRGMMTSEDCSMVPKFVKRSGNFLLETDRSIEYSMIWTTPMIRPASISSMLVSRVELDMETEGIQSILFFCNGENPFKNVSGKEIINVKCESIPESLDDDDKTMIYEEVLKRILGVFVIDEGNDAYIKIRRLPPQYYNLQDRKNLVLDNAFEKRMNAVNAMLEESVVSLSAYEEAVPQSNLHLYNIIQKEGRSTQERSSFIVDEESTPGVNTVDGAQDKEDSTFPGFPGAHSPDLLESNTESLTGSPTIENRKTFTFPENQRGNEQEAEEEHNPDTFENPSNKLHSPLTLEMPNCGHISSPKSAVDAMDLKSDVYNRLKKVFPLFYKNADHEECRANAMLVADLVQDHINNALSEDKTGAKFVRLDNMISTIVTKIQEQNKQLSLQGGLLFLAIGSILVSLERLQDSSTDNESLQDEMISEENSDAQAPDSPAASNGVQTTEKKFFFQLSQEDICGYLLDELDERREVAPYLKRISYEYEKKVIWEMLEKAKAEHEEHDRTVGGHFLKLVKLHKKNKDVVLETTRTDRLVLELRNYQRRVVEMATDNWTPRQNDLHCKNFAIMAPTGSGKTAIFIECARIALTREPRSKIVVIVPTVPLSKQHEGAFLANGFGEEGWRVESYSSENPITRATWASVLQDRSVIIMTAQILLNLLDSYTANISQIDLLVLDEVHHAKANSPYKKIMDYYTAVFNQPEAKCPKVLGFSASPAHGDTFEKTYNRLKALKIRLKADLIYIKDDNPEVQATVPTPEERIVFIDLSEEDIQVQLGLANFIELWKARIESYLDQELPSGESSKPASNAFLSFLSQGSISNMENCMKSYSKLQDLTAVAKSNLTCCSKLVIQCTNSLQFVNEFGYRKVLSECATECARIAEEAPGDASLFQNLIYQLCRTVPLSLGSFMMAAFQTDLFDAHMNFSKFTELVKFLDYSRFWASNNFHGIVFTETRSGVKHLAKLLRQTPSMKSVKFLEFMGHGTSKNSLDAKTKGMTGKQQEFALEEFRKPGTKVLIATSAAEEGLDIVSCEFVIRYTLPKTGIQRVQSKGRSRKGGIYLSLVVRGSLDSALEEKSRREENLLKEVLEQTDATVIA